MITGTMKKVSFFFCFILAIILPGTVSAGVPNGAYEFAFGADMAVWDITGHFDESVGGIHMNLDLAMDEQGKFTGSGAASGSVEGLGISMDFTITGSFKTSGGVTYMNMKMPFNGYVSGYGVSFHGTAKVNTEVDPETATMYGQIGMTFHAGGESASIKQAFQMQFPEGMTGEWTLDLEIVNVDGKNLVGNGSVEFVDGKTNIFPIKGKYSPKKNTASLTLKNVDTKLKDNEINLSKVQVISGSVLSGIITYKLRGQKRTGSF